jgi:DNA-binding response OmpR family regulator
MNTKGKILIGNDRSGMLQFSCKVLEEQGYEVICIDDALQILETVRSTLPELVLLNSRQVDGLEICRTIRACADLQDVWVVLMLDELTGMGIREAGVEAGVNDYLVWPIDKSSVLMRVETIIERRKNEISIRQREEKLAQRLREISAFQVIGMQIYQLHSVDEILSTAMDEIFKAFHPDRVIVCLFEDGKLQVKASRTAWNNQLDQALPTACEEGCVCMQVLQDGKSWFSMDAKVDRGCALMQGRADDLISVAVLPLQMGKESFGVVGLSGVNGQVFEQYAPVLRSFPLNFQQEYIMRDWLRLFRKN